MRCELALRFLADETEEELLVHLQRRKAGVLWETSERIMVGVTDVPGTDTVLRRAARLAARSKGELHAVHVLTGDAPANRHRDSLEELRHLASDLGATWVELRGDDPAGALMDFARRAQITQIVLGASQRSRWRELLSGGSIVWKVQRLAAVESVDVHIIARLVIPQEGGDGAPELLSDDG